MLRGANIPDAAPPGSSSRIVADRAYQIAAAYFYSRDYEEARNRWIAIAADKNSPWHVIAPYLVARSYLRENKYQEAESQLQKLLADPAEASLYPQARRLEDFAHAHLDPAGQLLTLSNRLMLPQPADIGHDLNDYTFLTDRFEFGSNLGVTTVESFKKLWDQYADVAAKATSPPGSASIRTKFWPSTMKWIAGGKPSRFPGCSPPGITMNPMSSKR